MVWHDGVGRRVGRRLRHIRRPRKPPDPPEKMKKQRRNKLNGSSTNNTHQMMMNHDNNRLSNRGLRCSVEDEETGPDFHDAVSHTLCADADAQFAPLRISRIARSIAKGTTRPAVYHVLRRA